MSTTLSFRRLKYFKVFARELHFGNAARLLGITQPALWQQVRALEKDVGTSLVVARGSKGTELTSAGLILADEATKILSLCDDMMLHLQDAVQGYSGVLRVAYTLSGASLGQQEMVEQFRKQYPEVRISADVGCCAQNLVGLRQGEADIVFLRQPPRSVDIESIRLADEELVTVLPSGHQLASLERIDREQVRNEPTVLLPRRLGPELYDHIVDQVWGDEEPVIHQEVPDYESACSFVERGTALAVLDRRVAERHAKGDVVIRRFAHPVPTTQVCVAWLKENREPAITNFVGSARRNLPALMPSSG